MIVTAVEYTFTVDRTHTHVIIMAATDIVEIEEEMVLLAHKNSQKMEVTFDLPLEDAEKVLFFHMLNYFTAQNWGDEQANIIKYREAAKSEYTALARRVLCSFVPIMRPVCVDRDEVEAAIADIPRRSIGMERRMDELIDNLDTLIDPPPMAEILQRAANTSRTGQSAVSARLTSPTSTTSDPVVRKRLVQQYYKEFGLDLHYDPSDGSFVDHLHEIYSRFVVRVCEKGFRKEVVRASVGAINPVANASKAAVLDLMSTLYVAVMFIQLHLVPTPYVRRGLIHFLNNMFDRVPWGEGGYPPAIWREEEPEEQFDIFATTMTYGYRTPSPLARSSSPPQTQSRSQSSRTRRMEVRATLPPRNLFDA